MSQIPTNLTFDDRGNQGYNLHFAHVAAEDLFIHSVLITK